MAHVIIITTPPSNSGGGSRVAHEHGPTVDVTYSPPHGLTAAEERRNIEIIERLSAKFYEKLQQRLESGSDED